MAPVLGNHCLVNRLMKGVCENKQTASPKILHNVGCKYYIERIRNLVSGGRNTVTQRANNETAHAARLVVGRGVKLYEHCNITPGAGMDLYDTKCTFTVNSLSKQSRQGAHLAPVTLHK